MRKITISTSTVRSRRKVFVDTAGWYAVSSADDRWHDLATRYYLDLLDQGCTILTSDYILDETITRLRYDVNHASALTFWRQIEPAISTGVLTVQWVDRRIWMAAMNIFRRYEDQDFSFTDCTSFVLAEVEAVDEVFTIDRHFLTMGFVIRPV